MSEISDEGYFLSGGGVSGRIAVWWNLGRRVTQIPASKDPLIYGSVAMGSL